VDTEDALMADLRFISSITIPTPPVAGAADVPLHPHLSEHLPTPTKLL